MIHGAQSTTDFNDAPLVKITHGSFFVRKMGFKLLPVSVKTKAGIELAVFAHSRILK
jgi:hypothetical protein